MTALTYEFTPEQNILLAHLASRMRVVGRVLMTLALLAMVQAFLSASSVIGLEVGIVLGLFGLWSVRAGSAFSKMVTTQGQDVAYLMRALNDMRRLYDFQFWLFIGLAALLAFTLLAAIGRFDGIPAAW